MRRSSTSLRRCAFVCGAAALLASPAGAAEVELGLVAGVQQTGDIVTREGTLDLAGDLLYGVTAGWRVRPDGIVELAWSRQSSEATGELTIAVASYASP